VREWIDFGEIPDYPKRLPPECIADELAARYPPAQGAVVVGLPVECAGQADPDRNRKIVVGARDWCILYRSCEQRKRKTLTYVKELSPGTNVEQVDVEDAAQIRQRLIWNRRQPCVPLLHNEPPQPISCEPNYTMIILPGEPVFFALSPFVTRHDGN